MATSRTPGTSSPLSCRAAGGDGVGDVGQVDRPGVTEQQGDAEEEEGGGEGAEEEVLERGLLREQPAAAGQPREDVQRQRQDLEGDEHRQQVTGRREEHHPADGEEGEGEDLRGGDTRAHGERLLRGPWRGGPHRGERVGSDASHALGHGEHAHERQHDDGALEEQPRPVDDDGPLDAAPGAAGPRGEQPGGGGLVVDRDEHDGEERDDEADERHDHLDAVAGATRDERLHERADQGEPEDDEHGQDGRVVDRGRGEVGGDERAERAHLVPPWGVLAGALTGTTGAGSLTPMWRSVVETAGLMRSRAGLG